MRSPIWPKLSLSNDGYIHSQKKESSLEENWPNWRFHEKGGQWCGSSFPGTLSTIKLACTSYLYLFLHPCIVRQGKKSVIQDKKNITTKKTQIAINLFFCSLFSRTQTQPYWIAHIWQQVAFSNWCWWLRGWRCWSCTAGGATGGSGPAWWWLVVLDLAGCWWRWKTREFLRFSEATEFKHTTENFCNKQTNKKIVINSSERNHIHPKVANVKWGTEVAYGISFVDLNKIGRINNDNL